MEKTVPALNGKQPVAVQPLHGLQRDQEPSVKPVAARIFELLSSPSPDGNGHMNFVKMTGRDTAGLVNVTPEDIELALSRRNQIGFRTSFAGSIQDQAKEIFNATERTLEDCQSKLMQRLMTTLEKNSHLLIAEVYNILSADQMVLADLKRLIRDPAEFAKDENADQLLDFKKVWKDILSGSTMLKVGISIEAYALAAFPEIKKVNEQQHIGYPIGGMPFPSRYGN